MPERSHTEIEELVAIKKLLILQLAIQGLTQTEIGSALGVDRTTVAKWFPSGLLAQVGKKGSSK